MSRDRSSKKRSREESSEEESFPGELKKLRTLPPENRIVESKLNERKKSKIVDIFTFGANEVGQLGSDPTDQGASPKLQFLKEVSDLNCISYCCSDASNLVIEANNKPEYRNVYTWGGDEPVLARHMDDDSSFTPSAVESLHEQPLIQIAAGSNHVVALTSTGEVVSWGIYKDRKGKSIGFRPHLPKEDFQDVPEIMVEIEEDKIIQVACTNNRSLALTETGEVYEWGNTRLDNRTLARHVKDTLLPSKVLIPSKIVAIYAESNGGSIFAEAQDGTVFAWGNNQHYQLGVDEEIEVKDGLKNPEAAAERAQKKKEKISTHSRPTKAKQLNTILEDNEAKIKKISCGRLHTVLLTEDGDVYTWGNNTKGQLGLGLPLEETISVPTKLALNKTIVDVASGPFHTLLLTENGDVYGFGANKDRCLGGLDEINSSPAKISLDHKKKRGKIVGLACGSRHNLVIAATQ
eukprot:TRINITY_DN2959_c0_g1_i1.p1 TRINITY_DN2959_c0_g1~~TRINITY_DN2959_c0_g1_i1.p1  ORF type:complete len:473 (-),score=135.46 TRINITY_DN2959_c0_g1_i1:53-1441(-)